MDTVSADGLLWAWSGPDTDDDIGFGNHERYLEPCFRRLLGHGVFLDVGAHVGHWALRMASQASQVIAVEAHPETAQVLRENVSLNGISNVTVIEAAAWDSRTVLHLEGGSRRHSGEIRTVPDGGGMEVLAAPLDELLDPDQEISLVKMDVEGSDLHVLRGMRQILARHKPDLMIERHDICGYYTSGDMQASLTELGYEWQDLPGYWLARPQGEPERDIAVAHEGLPTSAVADTGLPHRVRLVCSGDGGNADDSVL